MITCRLYRDGKLSQSEFDPAAVSDLLKEGTSRVWLDIEEPTDADLAMLGEEFSLHPLSIEDAAHRGQRTKIDVFDGYISVVLHAVELEGEPVSEQRRSIDKEIHAFAGERFLVTLRFEPAFDLKGVVDRFDRHPELTSEGGGFLLWAVLDEVVDEYLRIIDRHEEMADEIEDRVFADDPDPDIQQRIFEVKRRIVQFRRVVVGLRDVLSLIQDQPGFVTPKLAPYYRDVTDHTLRVMEFVDNVRDLLTTALEAQLSQVSNRLNVVMKKLSAWAGIVLVPTLIAGIYGMNFRNIPELDWRFGYPLALGTMALSSLVLYRVFKKRDWL